MTQVIAEYLSEMHEPRLDGIMFESAQKKTEARNIVLFHHVAKVEAIKLPHDTKLSSHTQSEDEDGHHPDYTVIEETPHETGKEKDEEDYLISEPEFDSLIFTGYDPRQDTLKVNLENISVHHVSGIKYEWESFPVSRHRWKRFKKGEEPF